MDFVRLDKFVPAFSRAERYSSLVWRSAQLTKLMTEKVISLNAEAKMVVAQAGHF